MGPGFQDPHPCLAQGEILTICGINEAIQNRIFERLPPVAIVCRLG